MANIQQILGTDSISASRTVINDNFSAINAELVDILSYLDTTNLTLSGMSLVETDQLTVPNVADLSAGGNVFYVAAEFSASLEASAAFYRSGFVSVTSFPASLTSVHSTIILDASASPFNLPVGAADGHEITIVAGAALASAITDAATKILGAPSDVDFEGNGATITLRYSSALSLWIVISSYNTTIA